MAMVAKKEKTGGTAKKTATENIGASSIALLTPVAQDKSYAKVFNQPQNPALTAQYVRTYRANQRQGNAKTKTRGEVAGSGKKPWKQKGTGRARVGSIRTPVWRHGGISHGPVLRDWHLNFPKKMKSKVFLVALSHKALTSKAFFLEEFNITEGRTKEVLALIQGWNLPGKLVLVVGTKNQNLHKGASNLADIKVVDYKNLNAYQLLWANAVVFEKSALDKIVALHKAKEKYAKSN